MTPRRRLHSEAENAALIRRAIGRPLDTEADALLGAASAIIVDDALDFVHGLLADRRLDAIGANRLLAEIAHGERSATVRDAETRHRAYVQAREQAQRAAVLLEVMGLLDTLRAAPGTGVGAAA